jgi:hypothetical protein
MVRRSIPNNSSLAIRPLSKAVASSTLSHRPAGWMFWELLFCFFFFCKCAFSGCSDGETLASGVILCSLGVRYMSYCANIARTLLIEPTSGQEKNYTALLGAFELALKALVPGFLKVFFVCLLFFHQVDSAIGKRLCDVYNVVKEHLTAVDESGQLATCLAKVFCFCLLQ